MKMRYSADGRCPGLPSLLRPVDAVRRRCVDVANRYTELVLDACRRTGGPAKNCVKDRVWEWRRLLLAHVW